VLTDTECSVSVPLRILGQNPRTEADQEFPDPFTFDNKTHLIPRILARPKPQALLSRDMGQGVVEQRAIA